MTLSMNQTIAIMEASSLWEWLQALNEITQLIYVVPILAFFALLVTGYTIFSGDLIGAFMISSVFIIFISISLFALQLVSFYMVAVFLAILVISIILKIMFALPTSTNI